MQYYTYSPHDKIQINVMYSTAMGIPLIKKPLDFRKKAFTDQNMILTFNDVLCKPGYTNFSPEDCDIKTNLGPFTFESPIISAAMDTVTEDEMAIAMALHGGLGVIHRNCPYERQLEMVKKVKRARNYIIQDVYTVFPETPISTLSHLMENKGISGFPVIDKERKVLGIVTKRDLPFESRTGKVEDIMTKNPVCLPPDISRETALQKMYDIRKEKIPLVDEKGRLAGLITKKDLKPNFPFSSKDDQGRLLCGLGCSPFFPPSLKNQEILKAIDNLVDIFFTDVAEFYKKDDMQGAKKMMEELDSYFVLGNIGTYEAAEAILTYDYPEDKLIGLKVGMGSGSICTTAIQTGVGAPTFYATAEVADAIKDYNPKIGLIADGGFKYPGDLVKAFAIGADIVMSGHFFAGCTESPGYIDTVNGRKVKVYRGMGSAEARAVGNFADDRYITNSKKLAEGVSGYIPFAGPVTGVLEQLEDGLKNGLIYGGASSISEAYNIKIGRVTPAGEREAKPHDLIGT